jgi:hypothetical protein
MGGKPLLPWVRFPYSASHVSGVICWFSPLLRGFYIYFPTSAKINTSKFQLDSVDEEPLCGNATVNCLFIFILFIKSKGAFASIDTQVHINM